MHNLLRILILSLVVAYFTPGTSALVNSEEANALIAIRDLFGYQWLDTDIQNACNVSGNEPRLNGVICSAVGVDGIHVTDITIPSSVFTTTETDFPEAVSGLTYLTYLHLAQPPASTLKNFSSIHFLTKLDTLSLSSPAAGAFVELRNLTNLASLRLTLNKATIIPSLSGLSSLRIAILDVGGSLTSSVTVPDDMFDGVSSLVTLNIQTSSAGISSLPDFTNNTQITQLILGSNNITYEMIAAFNFTKLQQLYSINLSGNPRLNKLPASLAGCSKLVSINVDACSMTRPDSFFDMTHTLVNSISATSNRMTFLPDSLCQLPSRARISTNITLSLDNNPLQSLPECLSTQVLQSISLGSTRMTVFPNVLLNIYFKAIYWYGNDLSMTFSGDWQSTMWLQTITSLSLENVQLQAPFPNALKMSRLLTSIDCPGNKFTGTIDEDFFVGSKLTTFDVSGSPLSGPFPSSLGSFSTLTHLLVAGCKFTTIPDGIGRHRNLYSLDFSDNALNTIPDDYVWQNITKLAFNRIGGNSGLSTTIPQSWFSFGNGYIVNGTDSGFVGDFPALNSTSITFVYFAGNALDGSIKEPLKVSLLRELHLDRNLLNGSLPVSLGLANSNLSWNSFTEFNVSFNRLTGSLPPAFNGLRSLQVLSLNNNGLSGALPDFQLMNAVIEFRGYRNFFNVCQSDPHLSYTPSYRSCNVKDNIPFGACNCTEFFDGYCQADTSCAAPGTAPFSLPPGEAPTPIRPTPAAGGEEPIESPEAAVPVGIAVGIHSSSLLLPLLLIALVSSM